MLQPNEIIQTLSTKNNELKTRKASVGLISGIIKDAKSFLSNLFFESVKEIKSNKYKAEVDFPEVQKVSGTVTVSNTEFKINNLSELSGEIDKKIDELKKIQSEVVLAVKGIKEPDFSSLEKAVKSIKIPEVNIPEVKEVSINNLSELKKYFDDLPKKIKFPDINIPATKEIKIPEYPKEIKVSNFPKEEKEELIGFYWTKDDAGNLSELVEVYPRGEVVSSGWSIGRVKIDDKRG